MPTSAPLLAAPDFLKAYEARWREGALLTSLDECIECVRTGLWLPGLNKEKIDDFKDVDVFSARINLQYRLIFAETQKSPPILLYFDNHGEAYDWAKASRRRLPRIIERAQAWQGKVPEKPAIPRLDDDVPVPIASLDALHEMLANGMYAYIAHLDEYQRSYAISDFQRRSGSMFIRGGAGTGKTAIAIHRAAHLAKQQEIGRAGVLYLCYNNVLVKVVSEVLKGLSGGRAPVGIQVRTFHSWAGSYLRSRGIDIQVSTETLLDDEVNNALRAEKPTASLGALDPTEIVREIRNIIKPSGVRSVDEYLQLERHKAGAPLQAPARRAIWSIYEKVAFPQGSRVYLDDLPGIAVEELARDRNFSGFRAVVVDEGQDCTRPMARLAVALVKGDLRRITVLADPTQSIYPSGFYWARQEIAPRGSQNVVLRTPYRCTRQVHTCAASLYDSVDDAERDVIDLLPSNREGPVPEIRIEQSPRDAEKALVEAVSAELNTSEIPRKVGEIAVLVYSKAEGASVCEFLRRAHIPAEVVDRTHVTLGNKTVKVLTVHSAKGLDFPSVYLYRFRADKTDPSDRRSLLYVALTRSSFRLTLISDTNTVSPLLEDLNPSSYRLTGTARGVLAS
jgi:superfamily I DNA/RNA helicase